MKKIISLCMTLVLIMSIGCTALAASSTTVYNSSTVIMSKDVQNTMKAAKAGQQVDESLIVFSYESDNGMIDLITLEGIDYSKNSLLTDSLNYKSFPTAADIDIMKNNTALTFQTVFSDDFYNKVVNACNKNFFTDVISYGSYKPSAVSKTNIVTLNAVNLTLTDPQTLLPIGTLDPIINTTPVVVMGIAVDGTIQYAEGIVNADGSISAAFVQAPIVVTIFAIS